MHLQRAIRAFLKIRTSYDVLPLSFRLIIFDTALLVKRSLNILIHNGMLRRKTHDSDVMADTLSNRFGAAVGLQDFDLCRITDGLRLYERHSVLLAEP